MKITKPTRDSYRIDFTDSEFTTFITIFNWMRTGWINWLSRKGKRTQDQYINMLRESEQMQTTLLNAHKLPAQSITPNSSGTDYRAALTARIGSLCGTLSEGNITDKQADACKAAAFGLLAFAQECSLLSSDDRDKWGNLVNAASAYAAARARAIGE